jgi:hypothetical protein
MPIKFDAFKRQFTAGNIILALIYLLTNSIFIWKYLSGYLSQPWLAPLFYAIIMFIILFIPLKNFKIGLPAKSQTAVYFSSIIIIVFVLTWFMFQYNPAKLGVTRYPAVYNWLASLFAGVFPYSPTDYPSGFPFLCLLHIPAYLLGDLGFTQIINFLILAIIVYFKHYDSLSEKLRTIILLISAPVFLFEVAVRSDIFSNMIAVLLYLTIFEKYYTNERKIWLLILGLIAGFLLATRGVVLLILIIYLGYAYKKYRFNYIKLSIFIIAGFALTILPFAIWDRNLFGGYGPFAIQIWHIPVWFLVLSIIISAACYFIVKSLKAAYYAISLTLFGVILYPFLIQLLKYGLYRTIIGDYYDISYFCFALPFLLLSFNRADE